MTITQIESGLTTDQYSDLLSAAKDITGQVVIYRHNPIFDTDKGAGSGSLSFPFSADSNDIYIVRVYIDSTDAYSERWNGTAWSSAELITASSSATVAPKLIWTGEEWDLYIIKSDHYLYKFVSADGLTWDSGTKWSTVLLTNALFMSFADGGIPIAYVILSTDSQHIIAIDSTTSYDTGIHWANTITDFDALSFIEQTDDSTATYSHSALRHCLVLAGRTPNLYKYVTSGGVPVVTPEPTGGIVSFVVRPPNDGRPIQVSRTIPVDVYDQSLTFQNRGTARLMGSPSTFNPSNSHDTLWCISAGSDGDVVNTSDQVYYYNAVFYYSSRDGVHWSQNKIIPTDLQDFNHYPCTILRCGTDLYLVASNRMLYSKGCFEFFNTHTSLTVDISKRMLQYTAAIADIRQSSITLDNADNALLSTCLGQPGVLTVVTKFGRPGHLIQTSLEEIDAIQSVQERPHEQLQITMRDRASWIIDRSQSSQAEYWDTQVIGLDQFQDINGINDTGLAHSDVVEGSFTTALESGFISLQDLYKEGIFFSTFKSSIIDGHAAAIFKMPVPSDHGGTSADNSPTYGGVTFRAVDKSNLWMARYNFWTGKIELVERRNGVDTIKHSYTPDSAFTTRANAGQTIGLRVEFRAGKIVIYESTEIYSSIGAKYNPSYTYYIDTSTDGTPAWLQGYVGVVLCGFSDQTTTDTSVPPDPGITPGDDTSFGTMDSFQPTRFYAIGVHGEVARGSGSVGAPTWTDISPGTTLKAILSSSSGFDRCGDLIFHPYHLHRAILMGPHAILIGDDMDTTPTYTDTGLHTPTGYSWGWRTFGVMRGSINWDGYFGWLEFPTADLHDGVQYAYTHDDFATVHRTNLAAYPESGVGLGLTISQHASSWDNIEVFISMAGGVNKKSTDGGQTFADNLDIITSPSGNWGGANNLPYTLGGGVANTGSTGLVTVTRDDFGCYLVNEANVSVFIADGYGPRSPYGLESLTVDGNYLSILSGQLVLTRSTDAGNFWFSQPTNSRPGYQDYTGHAGWPTNPNFYIIFGGRVSVTFDGGATWTDITPFGLYGGGGYSWTKAVADLSEAYDVSGVH